MNFNDEETMSYTQTVSTSKQDEDTLSRLPTLITVRELARLLRVNRNTAYQAVERGEVPGVVRIGRNIRLCRRTVVRWIRGKDRVVHSPRRGK